MPRPVHIPGAGVFSFLLWAVLAGGIGWWVGARTVPVPSAPDPPLLTTHVDRRDALRVLRSEALSFLVVQKLTGQVVVRHRESSWAGEWAGVLWATVDWRWGVDLRQITESDLRRDGDVLVVRLPPPRMLDFGIQPGSVEVLSKSTALPKLTDLLEGGGQRRLLESRLRESAMAFARQQDMLPDREQIVARLNGALAALVARPELRLRFE